MSTNSLFKYIKFLVNNQTDLKTNLILLFSDSPKFQQYEEISMMENSQLFFRFKDNFFMLNYRNFINSNDNGRFFFIDAEKFIKQGKVFCQYYYQGIDDPSFITQKRPISIFPNQLCQYDKQDNTINFYTTTPDSKNSFDNFVSGKLFNLTSFDSFSKSIFFQLNQNQEILLSSYVYQNNTLNDVTSSTTYLSNDQKLIIEENKISLSGLINDEAIQLSSIYNDNINVIKLYCKTLNNDKKFIDIYSNAGTYYPVNTTKIINVSAKFSDGSIEDITNSSSTTISLISGNGFSLNGNVLSSGYSKEGSTGTLIISSNLYNIQKQIPLIGQRQQITKFDVILSKNYLTQGDTSGSFQCNITKNTGIKQNVSNSDLLSIQIQENMLSSSNYFTFEKGSPSGYFKVENLLGQCRKLILFDYEDQELNQTFQKIVQINSFRQYIISAQMSGQLMFINADQKIETGHNYLTDIFNFSNLLSSQYVSTSDELRYAKHLEKCVHEISTGSGVNVIDLNTQTSTNCYYNAKIYQKTKFNAYNKLYEEILPTSASLLQYHTYKVIYQPMANQETTKFISGYTFDNLNINIDIDGEGKFIVGMKNPEIMFNYDIYDIEFVQLNGKFKALSGSPSIWKQFIYDQYNDLWLVKDVPLKFEKLESIRTSFAYKLRHQEKSNKSNLSDIQIKFICKDQNNKNVNLLRNVEFWNGPFLVKTCKYLVGTNGVFFEYFKDVPLIYGKNLTLKFELQDYLPVSIQSDQIDSKYYTNEQNKFYLYEFNFGNIQLRKPAVYTDYLQIQFGCQNNKQTPIWNLDTIKLVNKTTNQTLYLESNLSGKYQWSERQVIGKEVINHNFVKYDETVKMFDYDYYPSSLVGQLQLDLEVNGYSITTIKNITSLIQPRIDEFTKQRFYDVDFGNLILTDQFNTNVIFHCVNNRDIPFTKLNGIQIWDQKAVDKLIPIYKNTVNRHQITGYITGYIENTEMITGAFGYNQNEIYKPSGYQLPIAYYSQLIDDEDEVRLSGKLTPVYSKNKVNMFADYYQDDYSKRYTYINFNLSGKMKFDYNEIISQNPSNYTSGYFVYPNSNKIFYSGVIDCINNQFGVQSGYFNVSGYVKNNIINETENSNLLLVIHSQNLKSGNYFDGYIRSFMLGGENLIKDGSTYNYLLNFGSGVIYDDFKVYFKFDCIDNKKEFVDKLSSISLENKVIVKLSGELSGTQEYGYKSFCKKYDLTSESSGHFYQFIGWYNDYVEQLAYNQYLLINYTSIFGYAGNSQVYLNKSALTFNNNYKYFNYYQLNLGQLITYDNYPSYITFSTQDADTQDPINTLSSFKLLSSGVELFNYSNLESLGGGYYEIHQREHAEQIKYLHSKPLDVRIIVGGNLYLPYNKTATGTLIYHQIQELNQLSYGRFLIPQKRVKFQWKCWTDNAITNESSELISAYVKSIDQIDIVENVFGQTICSFSNCHIYSDEEYYLSGSNLMADKVSGKNLTVKIRRQGFRNSSKVIENAHIDIYDQYVLADLGQIYLSGASVQSVGFSCQRIFPMEDNRTECINDSATLTFQYTPDLSPTYRFNKDDEDVGYVKNQDIPDNLKIPCVSAIIGFKNNKTVLAKIFNISGENDLTLHKTYFKTLKDQLAISSQYLPYTVYNKDNDLIDIKNTSYIDYVGVKVYHQQRLSSMTQILDAGLISYNKDGSISLCPWTFVFNDYADCLTFENVIDQTSPLATSSYITCVNFCKASHVSQLIYAAIDDNPFSLREQDDGLGGRYENWDLYFPKNGSKMRFYCPLSGLNYGNRNCQFRFCYVPELNSQFKPLIKIKSSGNIMSLLNFVNKLEDSPYRNDDKGVFHGLFHNTHVDEKQQYAKQNILYSAPRLPATEISPACYQGMFEGCTNLVSGPVDLPATTVYRSSYKGMFYNCSSLINMPTLPATILAVGCYDEMFYGCTSLSSFSQPAIPPDVLPAPLLESNCFQWMFSGCQNLSGPIILPGKTYQFDHKWYGWPFAPYEGYTGYQCHGMFYNCKKIDNITIKNARLQWEDGGHSIFYQLLGDDSGSSPRASGKLYANISFLWDAITNSDYPITKFNNFENGETYNFASIMSREIPSSWMIQSLEKLSDIYQTWDPNIPILKGYKNSIKCSGTCQLDDFRRYTYFAGSRGLPQLSGTALYLSSDYQVEIGGQEFYNGLVNDKYLFQLHNYHGGAQNHTFIINCPPSGVILNHTVMVKLIMKSDYVNVIVKTLSGNGQIITGEIIPLSAVWRAQPWNTWAGVLSLNNTNNQISYSIYGGDCNYPREQ